MNKRLLSKFTNHTRKVLDRARLIAINQEAQNITNLHLLYSIAFEKGSVGHNILKEIGFERNSLFSFRNNFNSAKNIPFSNNLKETFKQAAKIASRHHYPYIGTEHLTYALIKSEDDEVQNLLDKAIQRTMKNTQSEPRENAFNPGSPGNPGDFGQMPDFAQSMSLHLSPKERTVAQKSSLDRFATNLNDENGGKDAHPIIGREKEIDRLISVLLRKNKNNPVLIGEPGVGKTAVVAGLAQKINQGEVPAQMADKIIYELDLGLLLSGTTFRGEFEQRMKDVIEYASNDPHVILFIDEIHNLMGAGSAQGSLDAANMLKPALAKGALKLIGATTFDEYKKHIEKDAALERRFQPIIINEPQDEETRKILNGIKKNYEEYHKVIIDKKAIDAAITLSQRYVNDRFLPDKAIDLIDEAQAEVKAKAINFDVTKKIKRCIDQKKRMEALKEKLVTNNEFRIASSLKKDEKELEEILEVVTLEQKRRERMIFLRVTERDIKSIISKHTGIPVEEISTNNSKDVIGLKRKLAAKIIGQNVAINAIVNTLKRSLSGINDPNRPLGSFILLGPTGTGKTYFAKTLAELLFKNPASFIRIDMSEFSQKHNVSQLIGAPAGYVGYEEGGKLTDKVRRNPYSLILFDEIEKAHPDAYNFLLQVLEEGILTDASGRTVNFKNTIILITSNLGAQTFMKETLGFNEGDDAGFSKAKLNVVERMRETMLPEMVNRFDNIVIFNPLTAKDLTRISRKEVEKLNARLKEKRVKLVCRTEVFEFLAQKSFDKKEGARLIRKNIENLVQGPLSDFILDRKSPKELTVKVTIKNDRLIFKAI